MLSRWFWARADGKNRWRCHGSKRSGRTRLGYSTEVHAGREGVALPGVTGAQPGAEPLLPLCGAAVRELALVDPLAGYLRLDVVVPDPGRRVQPGVDVGLIDVLDERFAGSRLRLGSVVGPDTGEAVRLQLEAHRVRGRSSGASCSSARRVDQILHVGAVLVGQPVCPGKRPSLGAEPALQLLIKTEVDVHPAVGRTVERPAGRACGATPGRYRSIEEPGGRRHVLGARP